jgi:cell shape-determining protein MreC
MTYRQKNKRKNKDRNKQIIFVIVLLLVLLFLGGPIKGLVQAINIPISRVSDAAVVPFSGMTNYFKSKNALSEQNKFLSNENKTLKIELLTLESLQEENMRLKEILEYQTVPQNRSLGRVLNRPPFSPFDTLVVDLGENSNTFVGAKTFFNNVLIGEVEEIYTNSSIVRLYSSGDHVSPVSIAGNQVEARGSGSGNFEILIPQQVEITIGEPVFLGDKVIGVVAEIDPTTSDVFQTIYFSYPFKLQELDWIEVQKN